MSVWIGQNKSELNLQLIRAIPWPLASEVPNAICSTLASKRVELIERELSATLLVVGILVDWAKQSTNFGQTGQTIKSSGNGIRFDLMRFASGDKV